MSWDGPRHMHCAHCLFSGLHGITFNTMANIFIFIKSDRSCFRALAKRFCASDPEVVNADVDIIKTILEAIESRSYVVDGLPTTKTSAIHGVAPKSETTQVSPPKSAHLKATAPPGGARFSYPQMRPKWDDITNLAEDDKVCCA